MDAKETGVEEVEGNGEESPNMDVDCVEKCGSVEQSDASDDA